MNTAEFAKLLYSMPWSQSFEIVVEAKQSSDGEKKCIRPERNVRQMSN